MSQQNFLLYRTNLPARDFLPNDPIGSRLNGGHLVSIEYKTQCTAIIFIRSLPSTTNFPEAKLSSTFLSPIHWKIFKDFFACKFVLAANHQQPENIQRLFRLQICLSRISSTTRKYSKTFWAINSSNQQQPSTAATNSNHQQQQPTATINSSNQQQPSTAATNSNHQQQQPAATINSSNQQQPSTAATSSNHQQQQPAATINSSNQQQPAATINSSNQQHQSTAATSSSNQKQQSTVTTNLVLPAVPPQSTTTCVRYNYGS